MRRCLNKIKLSKRIEISRNTIQQKLNNIQLLHGVSNQPPVGPLYSLCFGLPFQNHMCGTQSTPTAGIHLHLLQSSLYSCMAVNKGWIY